MLLRLFNTIVLMNLETGSSMCAYNEGHSKQIYA
jgi:hypothetical protein